MAETAGGATGVAQEPERGEAIAWVTRYNGKMAGVSSVHRYFEKGLTYCLRPIPDAERRFPIMRSLGICKRCDRLCARAATFADAVRSY